MAQDVAARAAPVDHPIVPVERGAVAHPAEHPSPRRHVLGPALEAHKRRLSTLARMHSFPLHHLHPRALVHCVVYRHHCGHVFFVRVVAFSPHGIEEHLRRWVFPHGVVLLRLLVVRGVGTLENG